MQLYGKMRIVNYFGEWSNRLDTPHGRGFCFGELDWRKYSTRIGYYTYGEPSDGKVLKLDKDDYEDIIFYNGDES